jgi:hypothetical protein
MKNYKYAIGLLFLLQTVNLFSQEIKVFNDEFRDGTAEYEYFINESYDIVYNGFFHYYGEKYTVNGFYKDNLPEGEWVITANDNVYSSYPQIQTNTLVKGSYSAGLLNGLWVYKNSFSLKDYTTEEFKKGDDADTDIATASFLNNVFIGDISFSRNFQKISITGSFDDKGITSGTWTYTKDYEEDIIKYQNGVACWRLVRNLPTGDKTLFIDSTAFVSAFWENYDSISNVSVLNGKVYYPEKVKLDDKQRVRPGVIDLTNTNLKRNRRTYENPAISIWKDIRVNVYQSHSETNPLYYGIRDSRKPLAYEILIKQCSYTSSKGIFISNDACTKKLRELKY